MKKNLALPIIFTLGLLLSVSCGKQPDHSLKVMSYNIHTGIGVDGKRDLERIARIINEQDPDFVGLQEVDHMVTRTGWTDQMDELARYTGMHPIFAPTIEFQGGLYGIGALVKNKPIRSYTIPLLDKDEPRVLLVMEYENYLLLNTHLPLNERSRATAINDIGRMANVYGKPTILTGDFNATPDSKEITDMAANWTILSDTKKFTCPAENPSITLDYIMGYKMDGVKYKVTNFKVLNEPDASDHLPVYLEVKF